MADKPGVVLRFPHGKKKQQLEYLIEQYKKAHPNEDQAEFTPHLIAEWAVKKGLWKRPPMSPEEVLRREISRHLHDEYFTDPQGREVRSMHPVPVMVQTPKGAKRRWVYRRLFQAPPDHAKVSFRLRLFAAERDVRQLHLDFLSYQDNNDFGATLEPMDYDFNKTVAESQLPTTYPDEPLDPLEDDNDGDDDDVN
jgi:hypothetical protein